MGVQMTTVSVDSNATTEYKETEVGTIPTDWNCVRLYSITMPQSNKTSLNPQNYPNEEFDYYSIPNLHQLGSPAPELGSNIHSQKILVESGTVLFGKLNPRVPKIWLVDNEVGRRKIATTEFIPLVPRGVNQEFLYFLMQSDIVIPKSQKLVSGSTPSRQRVDVSKFLEISLPFPPLPEQRRIAAVLNTIQDEIAAQDDLILELREFKRSVIERLFTYGVDDTATTKATLFGDVPLHWDTMPLDQCAYVQTGSAKGRRFRENDEIISVPYLRVANVQDGYLDLREIKNINIKRNELDRYLLEDGDVLMTEGGDFDKLGRGFVWNNQVSNCIHQNHIFSVRVDRRFLIPEFLAFLLQSSYGKSYFLSVAHRTTNLASINSTKLKAFPILIPTKQEQSKIVSMLQIVDSKIAAEEDRKAALQELFKSMLHQLMSGQIRLLSDEGWPL